MLARILGLLAFSLLSLASPTRASVADLNALLIEIATEKFHGMDRGPDPARDPGEIVLSAARSGLDAEATIPRLVASLQIPPEGATSLLRAVLRDGVARARRMSRARQIPTEAELRSIETDYRKARDSAPENVETLRSLFFFYRTWGRSGFLSGYPEKLVADVRRMADPGPPAMELLVENPGDDLTRDLLALIPERYRDHPAVLSVPLSRFLYSWAGPPLAARALEGASKISPPPDRRVLIHLAELQLRALIDKGLTSEAISTFERLAPQVANEVLAGEPESFRVRVGKLPYRGYRSDLRLDLAAAFVLEGRAETAERILRLTERGGGQRGREKQNTSQRALLRALAAPPSAEDPFDRLADALGNEAVHPTVWALVFARYAERGGYRDAAADKVGEARERLTSLGNAKMPDFLTLPLEVSAEASKLRDRGRVMEERLGRQVEALRSTSDQPKRTDDMAPTVARLLDAARSPRYTERPLPQDVLPIETSNDDQFEQTMRMRKEILVPGDFALSRVDRSGDEILAIGIPWGQNWTAEAGSGGYWLIRSRDGGSNWSKPLYTGLRRSCPYSVRWSSDLPLMHREGLLQIEVDAWEREGACPDYSQIVTAVPVKRSGIFVEIAISTLGEDADGDGLTDFLEEDLLTDPRDPDTDRDGIDDRTDLLPNIRSGRSSPESDAMASVVEYFVQWRLRTEIGQRRPPPPETLATRSWIENSVPRTFFFVTDRRHFDSRSTSARAMVLTPEEWKRVREKSGIPRAWMLTTFILDRTKTRGVVRWSGASEWGALRLEKTEDGWRVESVSHLIAGLTGPSGHRIRPEPREET